MARTMDLMTMEPGTALRRMFGDSDRLFGSRQWPLATTRTSLGEFPWLPDVEMKEHDGYLTVRVDLPGVRKEEVTITVAEGMLTFEGERKREAETHENEWFTTERTYGRFFRSISLPEGVKYEDVKATFTSGVLDVSVKLPAAAATFAPRAVPISDGGEKAEKKAVKAA